MHKTVNKELRGILLVIAVCVALGAGCAKISEPQPPEIHVPKPATDLVAQQLADSIMLTFAKPSQNTDGSSATTLAQVDVLRVNEDAAPGFSQTPLSEEQFIERAIKVRSIPSSAFANYLQGGSFVIQDKLDFPDRSLIYSCAYRYAVLSINKKNQTAGLSNQILIQPVAIPLPPGGLSAKVTESYIGVRWAEPSENMDGSTPPRIAGYKIFRAEISREFPAAPINSDLLKKPEFEDHDFQFDKSYHYEIRTVGSMQNPYAASLPSEVLSVEARDVFPPAPPENFNAIREGGVVILLWTQSSSADVDGYRIYRQDTKTAARVLLQKELITVLNYRDSQAEPDREYEYAIQAVDTHGNESALVRASVETH